MRNGTDCRASFSNRRSIVPGKVNYYGASVVRQGWQLWIRLMARKGGVCKVHDGLCSEHLYMSEQECWQGSRVSSIIPVKGVVSMAKAARWLSSRALTT